MDINKSSKILIYSFFLVTLLSMVTAVCTVNFDKSSYFPGETVTATMQCDDSTEKLKSYSLLWGNESGGTLLETDTGTTPNTVSQPFYATYLISTGVGNFTLNATLTGTSLEGYDSAQVIATTTSNSLFIKNITMTNPLILVGKKIGMSFIVTDENNKKISNAQCDVIIKDGNGFPIDSANNVILSFNGIATQTQYISIDNFQEDRQYLASINCFCASANTSMGCVDEDGLKISNSVGSTSGPFYINKWLQVNTVTDKSLYQLRDEIFICANLTNLNYTSRIPVRIFNQVRCSAGTDNSADLDRVLIASDDNEPDERGIGVGATQEQCKRFIIPEAKFLEGKNSQCYASTNVVVLNEKKEDTVSYSTTSPVFNITSTELNVFPDWVRIEDYVYNSIINLSSLGFSGVGTGDVDIKLKSRPYELDSSKQTSGGVIDFLGISNADLIHNISAFNLTSSISPYLELTDDGSLEIELREVDMTSSGWYNITLSLHSFNERSVIAQENQSTALQTIANNTGTFLFNILMEDNIYGSPGQFTLTAIREFGTGAIEGTFECYVNGFKDQTVQRWSQSIPYPEGLSVSKTFTMPENIQIPQAYTLICKVGTAGIGNTITTATKTFIYNAARGSASAGVVDNFIDGISNSTWFQWPADKEHETGLKQLKRNPLVIIFLSSIILYIYLTQIKGKEDERQ